jgi:adenylate cyclase
VERAYGWLYRRLGRLYPAVVVAIELLAAVLVTLGTLGLLRLYVDASNAEFLRLAAVAEGCVVCAVVVAVVRIRPGVRPLVRWVSGDRDGLDPALVWGVAVALPLEIVRRSEKVRVALVALPASVFATVELGLPLYSAAFFLAASAVAIAYTAMLHFFASELALAPVVRELADRLPDDLPAQRVGVPLRWKLLGAIPLINVITGVVVSGLSSGQRHSLEDIGVSVLVALVVAFTISLELTMLVSRSVLRPVRDLLDATERVKRGDLSVRVPVTSGDELGTLALGFNQMMSGLAERAALHEAFGSYVDPQVAARVLEEGARLQGEELEVTVVFIDVRDFTTFAEHADAHEIVAYVNEFLELVVPTLTRHGGHANKFVGDGVLGVFGAPVALDDHADRALNAASELASAAEQRFGERLRIGVGINSGRVIAGTIGGGGKLEFTVIGDPVNVASRVEQMTRETGDTVLLTDATRHLLSGERHRLDSRGALALRGRAEPVPVFALVASQCEIGQTPVKTGLGMPTGE